MFKFVTTVFLTLIDTVSFAVEDKKVKVDKSYPKYILNNKKKFDNYTM